MITRDKDSENLVLYLQEIKSRIKKERPSSNIDKMDELLSTLSNALKDEDISGHIIVDEFKLSLKRRVS